MNSLFITGSSGFIGRSLLSKIDPTKYRHIYCLSRNVRTTAESPTHHKNVRFAEGSIYDYAIYAPYLASSGTVIHLAAATGKVGRDEYFTINAKGTQFFIDQCKQAGVQNFLYTSSIAVKFADKSRYYYAQSKELGEHAVRNSGLNYIIVRPTIVIGKDAAIWKSLSSLARAPITPIFGDGTTKIQPIYVGDLIDCLLSIVYENAFTNETFELGGPDEITFENFLRRIHYLSYGKEPWVIHIPLKLLTSVLSTLEKGLYSLLPVTAGQLSAFSHDGTIQMNRIVRRHLSQMKGVDEMLRLVIGNA